MKNNIKEGSYLKIQGQPTEVKICKLPFLRNK